MYPGVKLAAINCRLHLLSNGITFFRFEKSIEKVFILENIGFIGHNNLSNFRIEIVKINDDFEIEKW